VKLKHWEKYPDLDIIDSDNEEWWYVQELDPPPANGREVIEAWAAGQAGGRAHDAVMVSTWEHNDEVRRRAEEAGYAAANAIWAQRH